MKIAQADIFGTIAPPPGTPSSPSTLLSVGINLFMIFAGLATLAYLLWGALDWITSSGEKEKLLKAQNKITNAAIGLLLIVVVLAVWNLIVSQILNIAPQGVFTLPHL